MGGKSVNGCCGVTSVDKEAQRAWRGWGGGTPFRDMLKRMLTLKCLAADTHAGERKQLWTEKW